MRPLLPSSTTHCWPACVYRSLLLLGLFTLGIACQQSKQQVQSYLEGRITVDSRLDTSDDSSNFRVLVLHAEGRRVDTLGHAVTDRNGRFRMTVTAPERGIYPLTVWGRQGQERLATTKYVVAPGDSGTLNAELPLERRLRVESPENVALLGYQNAMITHQRMLTRRLQAEAYRPNALAQSVRLTSSVLSSLQDNYPGTYAGQLATVESLSLLEGWNDSLVVAHAQEIDPSNPRYVEAARIARKAAARLHGQQAALDLIDTFEARATTEQQRAGVKAVRIQAFLDSAQIEAALAAAQQLKAEHPNSQWARWADRVQYEAEHLMPGMTAPNLSFRTLSGDSLSLRSLRGHPVVLEYYRPGSDAYMCQLSIRNGLYDATRSDSVAFVSISTEPDTLINRAFLSNQSLPGHRAIAPQGLEDPLVSRYNVVDVPTRFLINADGTIVDQYPEGSLLALRLDLTRLVHGDSLSVPPE